MKLTKKEKKAIECLAMHSRIDLSYEGGGTFNKGDDNNSFDEKDAEKVRTALAIIRLMVNK